MVDRPVPFLCECSDPGCVRLVHLSLGEYRDVRSNDRWFLHAPNHETTVAGAVQLVEHRPGYVLVEKVGLAGTIADELAAEGGSRLG